MQSPDQKPRIQHVIDQLGIAEVDYAEPIIAKWWLILKNSDWSNADQVATTRRWIDIIIACIDQNIPSNSFFFQITELKNKTSAKPPFVESIFIDLLSNRYNEKLPFESMRLFLVLLGTLIDQSGEPEATASMTTIWA